MRALLDVNVLIALLDAAGEPLTEPRAAHRWPRHRAFNAYTCRKVTPGHTGWISSAEWP
jgi:hypothetical protein